MEPKSLCSRLALAITKSSTSSLSAPELEAIISQIHPEINTYQIRGVLHSSGIFKNIGNSFLSIWTLNPTREAEIRTALRTRDHDSVHYPLPEKAPEGYFLPIRIVRLVLHSMANGGFTLREIDALVQNEFPRQVIISSELQDDTIKYEFVAFKIIWLNAIWTVADELWHETRYQQLLISTRDNGSAIRRSMKNPEDLPALLRGDLKHGYAVPLDEQTLKGVVVFVVEEEQQRELACTKEYPPPPYQLRQLITLAFKNSRSGQLSCRQVTNFILRHFPGFVEGVQRVPNAIHAICNSIVVRHVRWTVNRMQCQKEVRVDLGVKVLQPTLNVKEVRCERKCARMRTPLKRLYYTDLHNNQRLMDDSWTRERKGVYYKHEFAVEVEDVPDERHFPNVTQRSRC